MLTVPLLILLEYVVRELERDEINMISCCQSHVINMSYLLVFYKCNYIYCDYDFYGILCDSRSSWVSRLLHIINWLGYHICIGTTLGTNYSLAQVSHTVHIID